MDRHNADLTVIADGVLIRDDSDRIGALLRRVAAFQQFEHQIHGLLTEMVRVMDTKIATTFTELTQFMADTSTALLDALQQATSAAAQVATDLHTLLSQAPADLTTAQAAAESLRDSLLDMDAQIKAALAPAPGPMSAMGPP